MSIVQGILSFEVFLFPSWKSMLLRLGGSLKRSGTPSVLWMAERKASCNAFLPGGSENRLAGTFTQFFPFISVLWYHHA
jgi:hypothetical protein